MRSDRVVPYRVVLSRAVPSHAVPPALLNNMSGWIRLDRAAPRRPFKQYVRAGQIGLHRVYVMSDQIGPRRAARLNNMPRR